MAGTIYVAKTTAEQLLASSSDQVLVQLISPSSITIKIKEWGVFFDGVSVTAEPVLVKMYYSNSSFGEWTTHVPVKRAGRPALSQCTIRTLDTSCGHGHDSSGIICIREIHPQSGYQEKFSYGDEPEVFNNILNIYVNSPTSCNCVAELVWEE